MEKSNERFMRIKLNSKRFDDLTFKYLKTVCIDVDFKVIVHNFLTQYTLIGIRNLTIEYSRR